MRFLVGRWARPWLDVISPQVWPIAGADASRASAEERVGTPAVTVP
ncbi:MAG: hypothetical protein ACFE0R_05435 [Salinarimonas sp.]